MSHVPIRLRLTLPFAVGMAAVLAAMAVFVYLGSATRCSRPSTRTSRRRSTRRWRTHERNRALVDADSAEGPTLAQLRSPGGAVVRSQPPTLSPIRRRRDLARPVRFTTHLPGCARTRGASSKSGRPSTAARWCS